ncbi:MAG: hypothetical protein JXO22_14735 [Phycisphaerae bacterium]|nr:hypothetical protein [Phycisphaerae bacterium]
MIAPANAAAAKVLNLFVPGGGLILLGRAWSGVTVGLLFAACANLAVTSTLLFPDDFSALVQGLSIGVSGGAYFGAQIRLLYCLRELRHVDADHVRDTALRDVHALLAEGQPLDALAALEPIRHLAQNELLVAYRLAQALTAAGHGVEAIEAWEVVRRLDHHHLYRDLRQQSLAKLKAEGDTFSSDDPANGR